MLSFGPISDAPLSSLSAAGGIGVSVQAIQTFASTGTETFSGAGATVQAVQSSRGREVLPIGDGAFIQAIQTMEGQGTAASNILWIEPPLRLKPHQLFWGAGGTTQEVQVAEGEGAALAPRKGRGSIVAFVQVVEAQGSMVPAEVAEPEAVEEVPVYPLAPKPRKPALAKAPKPAPPSRPSEPIKPAPVAKVPVLKQPKKIQIIGKGRTKQSPVLLDGAGTMVPEPAIEVTLDTELEIVAVSTLEPIVVELDPLPLITFTGNGTCAQVRQQFEAHGDFEEYDDSEEILMAIMLLELAA